MVQIITSALVAFLLAAPSLAVPVVHTSGPTAAHTHRSVHTHAGQLSRTTGPHAHAHRQFHHALTTGRLSQRDIEFLQDLAVRDPSFIKKAFKKLGKVVNAKNLMKVAKFGASVALREDAFEELDQLSSRSDAFDLSELEELAARDPSFKSILKKVKKVANVKNLQKVAGFASNFVREDDLEIEFTQRELEALEDLAIRDPSFFKKAFKKLGKVVNAKNLMKVAKFGASVALREDEFEALDARSDAFDLSELEELAARDPSFKSILKKVKKVANVKNLQKVAGFASNFVREEELEVELTQRELEVVEELAVRDPNFFKKAFKKVKGLLSKKSLGKLVNIAGKVQGVAGNFIREEEVDDLLERDYADFELNELD